MYCSNRELSSSSLVEGDTVPTIWKAGSPFEEICSSSASSEPFPATHDVDKNCEDGQKIYFKTSHFTFKNTCNIGYLIMLTLATFAMCLEEYLSTSLMKIRLGRADCFLSSIL